MKAVAALLCLVVAAGAGAYATGLVGPEDVPSSIVELELGPIELPGDDLLSDDGDGGTACERLARLAAELGAESDDPTRLLRALGRQAAGIHDPPRGLFDLARGGFDRIPGIGFRNRFNDGTAGQARHFAGVAVATTFGGGDATRRISIFVRRDPPNSADGRLTDAAIEFSRLLRRGELETADAGDWVLAEVCRPPVEALLEG